MKLLILLSAMITSFAFAKGKPDSVDLTMFGPSVNVEIGWNDASHVKIFTENGVFEMRLYCPGGGNLTVYTTTDPGNETPFARIPTQNKKQCKALVESITTTINNKGSVNLNFSELVEGRQSFFWSYLTYSKLEIN